jgi:uncharacterized membrane protein
MGYFDALTDGSFKKTQNGRIAFYPWGALGTGYILPDEQTHLRVRGFVKRYLLVSLPAIVAIGLILGWLIAFFLLPAFMVAYLIRIRALLRGLAVTSDRLTVAESYRTQARGHSFAMLWVLEVVSILFVAMGVFIALAVREAWVIGFASAGFFALCAVAIAYMIRAKRSATTQTNVGSGQ